ncbi:hypothetical protein IGI66_000199 [Enterococcus sp. AZ048]|uniref:hypothetical protein n=1 Tax=Enterococcus sp. AZ048 TaxID=2774658 RepID=UPI003F27201D
MDQFNNAISVSGLGDNIHSALMQNAQRKVIESIMNAAQNGRTECKIKIKGTTPSFLAQLESEGVYYIPKEEEDYFQLFWEW